MSTIHHLPLGRNGEVEQQQFPSDSTNLTAYNVLEDRTPQPFLSFDTSPVSFKSHTWEPVTAPDKPDAPIPKILSLLDMLPQLASTSPGAGDLKIVVTIPVHVWKMYPSFDDLSKAVDFSALYAKFAKIVSSVGNVRKLSFHMEFVWCRLYAPGTYPELDYWSIEERTTTSLVISSGMDAISRVHRDQHTLINLGNEEAVEIHYGHTYIPY